MAVIITIIAENVLLTIVRQTFVDILYDSRVKSQGAEVAVQYRRVVSCHPCCSASIDRCGLVLRRVSPLRSDTAD